MDSRINQPETSEFSLSLAILNMDAQSPVLFLHISVDPHNRTITGISDLSFPQLQSSRTLSMEITGKYKSLIRKRKRIHNHVNLVGFLNFDQNTPDLKINMVIKPNWRNGKVFYEYKKDDKWIAVSDVYLKIKPTVTYAIPKSILDVNQKACLPAITTS